MKYCKVIITDPWAPYSSPKRYLNTQSIKRELRRIHNFEGDRKKSQKHLSLIKPRFAGCLESVWWSDIAENGSLS